MEFTSPLLGKLYKGEEFLAAGILYIESGKFLVELQNLDNTSNIESYIEELDPSSVSYQPDGGIAFGDPKFKPFPEVVSFYTAPGLKSYLLINCHIIRRKSSLTGGPYSYQRILRVENFVALPDTVLEEFGVKYSEVNESKVEISALNDWLGRSALVLEFKRTDSGGGKFNNIALQNIEPIIINNVPWSGTVAAKILIEGEVKRSSWKAELYSNASFFIATHKSTPLDKHIKLQQAFLALLEIAYGTKLSIQRSFVSRDDDYAVRNQKSPMRSLYRFNDFSTEDMRKVPQPLFRFDDISVNGISRWFQLLLDNPAGVFPFVRLIENEEELPLETQFLLCGVFIEHIGAMLKKAQKSKMCFQSQVEAILSDLRQIVVSGEDRNNWAQKIANSYNGIKHYDRKNTPSLNVMFEYLIDVKRVIRIWLAKHLGCSDSTIKRYLAENRYVYSFIENIWTD